MKAFFFLTSLAFLNFGQTAIFTIGLTICMLLLVEVSKGNQTIGDFVLVNALLMQLSIPLNFLAAFTEKFHKG